MSILSFFSPINELHYYDQDFTVHIDTTQIVKHDLMSDVDAASWAMMMFRELIISTAKGYTVDIFKPDYTPPDTRTWYQKLMGVSCAPMVAWRALPIVAVPTSAIHITLGKSSDMEVLFFSTGNIGAIRLDAQSDLLRFDINLNRHYEETFLSLRAGEKPSLDFDAPRGPAFLGKHPLAERASYHDYNLSLYCLHTMMAGLWMWKGTKHRVVERLQSSHHPSEMDARKIYAMRLVYDAFFQGQKFPDLEKIMLDNMMMDQKGLQFPLSPCADSHVIVHQSVLEASASFKKDWFDFGRRVGYAMSMMTQHHQDLLECSHDAYRYEAGGNTSHDEMLLRAFLVSKAKEFSL